MADKTSLQIVVELKDEASSGLKQLGDTAKKTGKAVTEGTKPASEAIKKFGSETSKSKATLDKLGITAKVVGGLLKTALVGVGIAGATVAVAGLATGLWAAKKAFDAIADAARGAAQEQLQMSSIANIAREIGESFDQAQKSYTIGKSGGFFVQIATDAADAGKASQTLAEKLSSTADSLELLTGKGAEDFLGVFQDVYRETRDSAKAMEAMGLAADLAAAKNIPLAQAGELLAKAYGGNVELLGRLSPRLRDMAAAGASADQIMAELAQSVRGAATAISDNFLVAQAAWKAQVGNLWEGAGEGAAKGLGSFYRSLADGMAALVAVGPLKGIGDELETFFTKTGRAAGEFLKFLAGEDIQEKFKQLLGAIGLTGDGSMFDKAAGGIEKFFTNLATGIASADVTKLAESLRGIREDVEKFVTSNWQVLSTIATDIQSIADSMNGVLKTYQAIASIVGFFPKAGTAAMNAVVYGTDALSNQLPADYWEGRASGGAIPGMPGAGDSVPALLAPGEVVLNRGQQAAMAAMGADVADMFRAAGVPGFAAGGTPGFDDWIKAQWQSLADWRTKRDARGNPVVSAVPSIGGRVGGAPDPTFTPGWWSAVEAAGAAGNRELVEAIARGVAGRIELIKRFPAVGIGGASGDYSAMMYEMRMRRALEAAGSSWAGGGAQQWAKRAAGGGIGGRFWPRAANRQRIAENSPGVVVNTVAVDQPSLRGLGNTMDRILRGQRERQFSRNSFESFGSRYRFSYGS